ncbi:MAG: cytochrome b [Rhodoferax sp.]|nr:cytochrome b [Rhodoferax sp.]
MSSSLTPSSRYTLTAIALHWLLGAALLGMIGVGWYMAGLPFSPQRLKLYNWHKWAGITILVLSAVRLGWRLTHRPPALPVAIESAMPRWQMVAYHATHHGMYALFFIVPLLGWAYSSAAGFPIVVFGVLPLPDFVPADKVLAELIKPVHGYAAYTLLFLVAAHVGAALKHQFIDRDGLIGRILPLKR